MKLEHLKGMKIAVLQGGSSPERDVSLLSGATIASSLQALGANITVLDTAQALWWQQLQGVELAWIALHGAGSEDGVVQGALAVLGVPYTVSGVLVSAIALYSALGIGVLLE